MTVTFVSLVMLLSLYASLVAPERDEVGNKINQKGKCYGCITLATSFEKISKSVFCH